MILEGKTNFGHRDAVLDLSWSSLARYEKKAMFNFTSYIITKLSYDEWSLKSTMVC